MICLQILIIVCLTLVCGTLFWNGKEHFWFIPEGSHMCESVNGLSRDECKRCANGAWCTLPSGNASCIEGDMNGALDGQACDMYEYGAYNRSLSLVNPPQPYWANTTKSWNWNTPYRHKPTIPKPVDEGIMYFRHGSPPTDHIKKFS